MKIGLHLTQDGTSYKEIRNIALEAEKTGLDSFWLLDHLHASPKPTVQFLECWTVLSALAIETQTIRLGTLVLNINNRNPALLAKMASSLDNVSNGRLDLGVGAGGTNRAREQKALGYETEFIAYGLPFPTKPSIRIEKLDEGLEIMRRMWIQDKVNFQGKHYSVKDAICLPKPIQKPHIPIWIGGMGGYKMIRIIAKHADGWNMMRTSSIEDYRSNFLKLKKACKEIGRNPDEIKTSIAINGTFEECKNKLKLFDSEGLDLAILRFPMGKAIENLRLLNIN